MNGQTSTIIEATNLTSPAQLATMLVDIRKFFDEYRLAQPPLPDNFLMLAPCSLLLTETEGDRGLRNGRVQITNPEGDTIYDKEWVIAPAREG